MFRPCLEGLPGFIYLGFIFSRGSIYLLRIYWDLLAVSVFQSTHTGTHPPPPSHSPSPSPSLSLRPHSPEELCVIDLKIYEDLLKNPNKSQKNKTWQLLTHSLIPSQSNTSCIHKNNKLVKRIFFYMKDMFQRTFHPEDIFQGTKSLRTFHLGTKNQGHFVKDILDCYPFIATFTFVLFLFLIVLILYQIPLNEEYQNKLSYY